MILRYVMYGNPYLTRKAHCDSESTRFHGAQRPYMAASHLMNSNNWNIRQIPDNLNNIKDQPDINSGRAYSLMHTRTL